MQNKFLLYCGMLIAFMSCAVNPYRHTNKLHKQHVKNLIKQLKVRPSIDAVQPPEFWAGTTNFGLRKPNFVIIHHTAQNSCEQTLRTFTIPRTQVSAHYVICKDGIIHHMLNDYFRAWHGGSGLWGSVTDINSGSIGIELDNNGYESFPDRQLYSLLRLLDTLKTKYQIPTENFIGHADIAPARKVDPNVFFPWKMLADKGFGIWYDDTTGVVIPENFDPGTSLRMIGYSIRDTIAAIGAFKRHFMQDTIPVLYEQDKKVLFKLFERIKNR